MIKFNYETEISDTYMERLRTYYELIRKHNARFSVMSENEVEKGWENFVTFHIIDALHILDLLEDDKKANIYDKRVNIIDIGTGGGLPGIPVYILREEKIGKCVLVEAKRKKAEFLQIVKESVALKNIEIANVRAECLGKMPEYREKFDVSLARAVGDMGKTLELSLPFVKIGGIAVIYKGIVNEQDTEFSTTIGGTLGGKTENIVSYSLKGAKNERNLIIIRKIRETEMKFPRQTGNLGRFYQKD